jgi:hypothetical protein
LLQLRSRTEHQAELLNTNKYNNTEFWDHFQLSLYKTTIENILIPFQLLVLSSEQEVFSFFVIFFPSFPKFIYSGPNFWVIDFSPSRIGLSALFFPLKWALPCLKCNTFVLYYSIFCQHKWDDIYKKKMLLSTSKVETVWYRWSYCWN